MPTTRRARPIGAVALCLTFLACEQVTDPTTSDPPDLFQTGTVVEAAGQLDDGTSAHAAITLAGDRLLARRVRLSPPAEREAVVGRVAAVEVGGDAGSLTLQLGDLEVAFDAETEFTAGEGEPVAREIALARLGAALSEGTHPWVEAARPGSESPQAPGDGTFLARVIRLIGEADAPQIRINVDWDNLVRNASPPPDGWLAVLGLRVEIRVSEGLTVIEFANDAIAKREFEGRVTAVDLDARSLTLENGTVIETVAETELALSHENAGSLRSLEAAAQALDAGLTVFASGVGLVRSEDPLVLVALRLHLRLRAELEEFRGPVTAVDLTARTFTLEDGTTVWLFGGTMVFFGEDPVRFRSLEAVAEALAAGQTVMAAGVGAVLGEASLLALRVTFSRALTPFEGLVVAVDLTARTVVLDDGTIVKLPPSPVVGIQRSSDDGDRVILQSLEEVAEALEAGKAVLAAGVGTLESEDPTTILAVRVVFFLQPPPFHRFEGTVVGVDLEARVVSLEGGVRVRVPSDDVIVHEDDQEQMLASLAAVAEAVAAGKRVVAHGVGELEMEEPRVLVAVKVIFALEPPGVRRFEGAIQSVDLAARLLTLEGGLRVRVTDDTKVHSEGISNLMLSSLEAVARALENGATVWTAGSGTVESAEPLIIAAVEIAFFARPPVYVFFEGTVASVNLEARTVTLDDGRVLGLSEASEIVVSDQTLPSLAAVAEALAAGRTVVAAGVAAPPERDGGPEQVAKIVFVVST